MYVKCQRKTNSRSSQMNSPYGFGWVEIWKPLIDVADRPDTARAQMGFLRGYTMKFQQRRDGKISRSGALVVYIYVSMYSIYIYIHIYIYISIYRLSFKHCHTMQFRDVWSVFVKISLNFTNRDLQIDPHRPMPPSCWSWPARPTQRGASQLLENYG